MGSPSECDVAPAAAAAAAAGVCCFPSPLCSKPPFIIAGEVVLHTPSPICLSMETRLDTHKWRAAVSSEMGGWAVGKPKAAKKQPCSGRGKQHAKLCFLTWVGALRTRRAEWYCCC